MKTFIAGLAIISLLAVGAAVYAHGGGQTGQNYGGHMMDNSQRGDHMGSGYGRHMTGPGGGTWKDTIGGEEGQKFLNETVDLRKDMHDKKFELREALRDPDTTLATVTKLEREIQSIKETIREKAPQTAQKRIGGYGGCWQ